MTVYSDEQIAQASALAAAKGPAQASREMGIPAGTLKSWLHRRNRAAQPQTTGPDAAPKTGVAVPQPPAATVATAPQPQRDEQGRWLPGVSPNPGGQTSAVREARRLAEEYSPAAMRLLWQLASDAETPARERVAALVALLDRGLGKPRQTIDLSGELTTRHEYDLTARILADPGAYALAEQLLVAASGAGPTADGDARALCLDGEWREVATVPACPGTEPRTA